MRQIRVRVPGDARESVTATLERENIEYLPTEVASGRDAVIVEISVPSGAVEGVLELLYGAGLPENAYTVVSDIRDTGTQNAAALTERFVEGPGGEGLSHPRLRERALDLQPGRATYVAFAALSAVVAAAGLLLNSAIVIVGAMVIAPFAGSSLSASVGAVISDREMVTESVVSQLLGLVVGFVSALAVGLFVRRAGFVPAELAVSQVEQVGFFLTPSLLALAIAVCAGAAGALALATDLPVSIAGVAIAAAIVPSVATAAIGVVWFQPLAVLGAVVLLFMNIVFINLTAYLALVGLGYRSSVLSNTRESFRVSLRTGAYALIVVAFAVAVAITGVATAQQVAFERAANDEVQSTLDEPAYEDLALVGVQVDYTGVGLFDREESVTVTVSRSTNAEYPLLAQTLREHISARTDRQVSVEVELEQSQQSRPPGG